MVVFFFYKGVVMSSTNTLRKNIKTMSIEKDLETIKNNLEKSEYIIEQGNMLLANNFTFTRTWDMEACSMPYKIDPIDWLANPNGDSEWTFMLNRFDFVEYLALASVLTGNETYLEHAKYLIFNWIDSHDEIVYGHSTRTLDTGMRIVSWIDVMIYLCEFELLSDKEFNVIEDSIIKQIIYMKDNYIPKYTLSNWGSIQTAAIIKVMPLISNFERKSEIYEWAVEEFETQMKLQVYDDGLHWEQSTMYHVEVMHYSMKLYDDATYNMPSDIKNIIYKMADALLYQMSPTKSFEAFGDSDISNLESILNLSAVIFKEDKFKVTNDKISNMDNLYEMSAKQIECYGDLTSNLPEKLNYDGFDSGMFTTRSSWETDANFTLFTNGTMGSGHAHADNNHLSIYYKGKPVVIDSGRYTYREDDSRRVQLKSAYAHSSVVVDKVAGSLPRDSWTYDTYLKPISNRTKHKGKFHFYEGTTLTTLRPHFYAHSRKVLFSDYGIWLVLDDVRSPGNHEVQSFFNIHPAIKPEVKGNEVFLNDLKLVTFIDEIQINESLYSPKYNEIESNQQIELSSDFKNQSISPKIFINTDYSYEKVDILRDNKSVISEDLGMAIKITMNSRHKITFIIINEELFDGRKNLNCEGMTFHAKAVVIEEINGEKEIYVMST